MTPCLRSLLKVLHIYVPKISSVYWTFPLSQFYSKNIMFLKHSPSQKHTISITKQWQLNMLRVLRIPKFMCLKIMKGKAKCTLVQALRLCTGRTAHRGSRGIAILFLDHGTRRGWGVSVTPRPLFTPGKDPVPILQEARWAPGPVWTGVENLAPTGIRSPDCPARSQSLYHLRYPAHSYE